MKRSGFKPRAVPMKRTAMKRGTSRMKQSSKVAPSKDERAWMAAVAALGCIVCRRLGIYDVPAAVHHIIRANKRIGHFYTLPLCCPGHHQQGLPGNGKISRHPNKTRFEAAYGTEWELWEATRLLLVAGGLAVAIGIQRPTSKMQEPEIDHDEHYGQKNALPSKEGKAS